jgi:hypothetical protein
MTIPECFDDSSIKLIKSGQLSEDGYMDIFSFYEVIQDCDEFEKLFDETCDEEPWYEYAMLPKIVDVYNGVCELTDDVCDDFKSLFISLMLGGYFIYDFDIGVGNALEVEKYKGIENKTMREIYDTYELKNIMDISDDPYYEYDEDDGNQIKKSEDEIFKTFGYALYQWGPMYVFVVGWRCC